MGDLIAALFSVAWGTVGLLELLWTMGALVAVLVSLGAIWRSNRRSGRLRGLDSFTRRWANRSILIRNGLLGVVCEVVFWVGIGAMLEPQSPSITPTAAIAGLVAWLMELAVIATVLSDEIIGRIIRRHLESSNG